MSQILSQCVLLVTLCCCCFVLVASRSYNNGLIFYDLQSRQPYLPPTVSVSRGRILANVKFSAKGSIWSTFGQPCECKGSICGCCAGIKVRKYTFNQKMCANITFVPKKAEAELDVYLNEKSLGKYGISVRDPPTFCIPVMLPIPASMCVKLSDIAIQGNNLNMCMDFLVRMQSIDLFEMHFQCMKMGLDGFQYLDKNGNPVIPPSSSKNEETTTQKAADDDEEYYEEEEEEDGVTTAIATATQSENEIVGNMQNTESENVLPSESAADKINEAAAEQQQQQQLLQEQMQQLQQQLQQTQLPQQQPLQSEQQELEIEHESEMSTTYNDASDIDEYATAATIAAATTTNANEPQLNEIIDAITMAPATATAQAPAATMSLESLEQFSDVATDTITVATTTTAATADAETATKAAAATATTNADANANASSNSNNSNSGDNIDGTDGDDDNDEDADESEADNEVDADAAEEEYEEDKSAAADNFAGAATDTESGSVNNDAVANVENMAVNVGSAADMDVNAAALPTTEAANAAAVQQLPAAVSNAENELEAMASGTDASVASAAQTEQAKTQRQEAEQVEKVGEALLTAVQAQMATARKTPRARLMARYRYLYG